jgi:hypothetical protein
MSLEKANSEQAEPARQSVPRQSLGTRTTSNWEVLIFPHEWVHISSLGGIVKPIQIYVGQRPDLP